ncbi:hypothetical protein [Haloarchaeobius litoreus]|nr:hypothetical protein [Haloarchaeobius litoreus]
MPGDGPDERGGATTMVVASVGLAGNFAQDVASARLDPRAAEE